MKVLFKEYDDPTGDLKAKFSYLLKDDARIGSIFLYKKEISKLSLKRFFVENREHIKNTVILYIESYKENHPIDDFLTFNGCFSHLSALNLMYGSIMRDFSIIIL